MASALRAASESCSTSSDAPQWLATRIAPRRTGGNILNILKVDFKLIEVRSTSWVDYLSEEDLAFVKRFVLASGTLKDLAAQYRVSYPTIRLRLDRLIAKVKAVDTAGTASHFELTLRSLYADGQMESGAFRVLLDTYHEEVSDAAVSA